MPDRQPELRRAAGGGETCSLAQAGDDDAAPAHRSWIGDRLAVCARCRVPGDAQRHRRSPAQARAGVAASARPRAGARRCDGDALPRSRLLDLTCRPRCRHPPVRGSSFAFSALILTVRARNRSAWRADAAGGLGVVLWWLRSQVFVLPAAHPVAFRVRLTSCDSPQSE